MRDAILAFFESKKKGEDATLAEIHQAVSERLGKNVPASSVRSYLNLNTPGMFERTGRGRYRLK